MSRWCEIFRAGKYKDAEGNDLIYTESDLDTIIKNFQEDENPAVPNVVGHPKHNSPAYGWVDKLKRAGKSLYASFKQVPQEFQEAVNSGLFKNRSVSLYPNLKLRHIGWLGAAAPKVKGMEEFCFNDEDEAITLDFADLNDYKFETLSNVLSRLRDFLIEKYDLETAESLISKWTLDDLKHIENKTPEEVRAFAEEQKGGKEQILDTSQKTPEQISDNSLKEFAEKIEAENREKDAKIKQMQEEIGQMEKRNRVLEFEQFAEELINDGNITPAAAPFVKDMLEIAHQQGTYDFAQGDEKSVKARLKDFFKSLNCVNFAEIATEENADDKSHTVDFSDPIAASAAVREYVNKKAKDGITINEAEAYNALKGVN